MLLHYHAIESHGGSHGVRDAHSVKSAVGLPHLNYYVSIFTKAAVYVRTVIKSHPFVDGNKRTAMFAVNTFLKVNGYQLVAKKGEIRDFTVRVATQELELPEIAAWLKKHSRKKR